MKELQMNTNIAIDYKKGELKYVSKIGADGIKWITEKPFGNGSASVRLVREFADILDILGPKEGDLILDAGCGSGWTTEWLALSNFKVIGADIAPDMLKVAKNRLEHKYKNEFISKNLKICWCAADNQQLPFKSNSFDKIIFYDCLHHTPDWRSVIDEIFPILKPGGHVIFYELSTAHFDIKTMEQYGNFEGGIHPFEMRNYLKNKFIIKIFFMLLPRKIIVNEQKHEKLKKLIIQLNNFSIISIPFTEFLRPLAVLFGGSKILKAKCIVIATKRH
jgi:ubiquinone/menaquinone biosynthesis C-methylase UbiE